SLHISYLESTSLSKEFSQLNDMEKSFFSDVSFFRDSQAQNFFRSIDANLQRGIVPGHGGRMMVSYSSYVSSNGKTYGVNYRYSSGPKGVILTKGTYQNGKFLQAVYEYDPKGKLLQTSEYRSGKLLQKKSHLLQI
ncbi:MAG: hypothetical protein AAF518_14375, partial [Spirochaetota bacterium]